MKTFWKTRQFWRNLAIMGVASLVIVLLTIASLRIFSRYGQSFIVPDLTGLPTSSLTSLTQEYGFEFVIIDSVYDPSHPAGSVLRHDPIPGSTVKRNRKFYVTLVSATPDMAKMPNLIDLSLRQATALLEAAGLYVGTVKYEPSRFQNAVLDQTYHGKRIYPGEKVRRGSYINLLVSGSKDGYMHDNFSEEEEEEF
ncbi:MAG: PASTA domain-containing protein [Bacteroidales bacterium]|nr:PASTA domain-containing protein [Bacteroidales bacterium]